MENKASHPHINEWSDAETTMSAAESIVSDLFDEADNDTMYHKPVGQVRDDIIHGQCTCESEEIAERILAWSLDLSQD